MIQKIKHLTKPIIKYQRKTLGLLMILIIKYNNNRIWKHLFQLNECRFKKKMKLLQVYKLN